MNKSYFYYALLPLILGVAEIALVGKLHEIWGVSKLVFIYLLSTGFGMVIYKFRNAQKGFDPIDLAGFDINWSESEILEHLNRTSYFAILMLSLALILVPGLITDFIGIALLLIPLKFYAKSSFPSDDLEDLRWGFLWQRFDKYIDQEEYELAIRFLRKSKGVIPEEMKAVLDGEIGEAYLALKNYPKAISYLRKATKVIKKEWEDDDGYLEGFEESLRTAEDQQNLVKKTERSE